MISNFLKMKNYFLNSADIPAAKSSNAPTIPCDVPTNTSIAATMKPTPAYSKSLFMKKEEAKPKKAPAIARSAMNEFPSRPPLLINSMNDPEIMLKNEPIIPSICSKYLDVVFILFMI